MKTTFEQHSPKICINKCHWSLAKDVKHVWITWLTHLLTLTSNKTIMGVVLGHVMLPVWSGISWYHSLGCFCSIWGFISAAVAFIWTKKQKQRYVSHIECIFLKKFCSTSQLPGSKACKMPMLRFILARLSIKNRKTSTNLPDKTDSFGEWLQNCVGVSGRPGPELWISFSRFCSRVHNTCQGFYSYKERIHLNWKMDVSKTCLIGIQKDRQPLNAALKLTQL